MSDSKAHTKYSSSILIYLLANPDIIVKDITDDHEFVFLACDGKRQL